MGQRLNIEIVKGKEVLANAYYHWSGFTTTAIKITNNILESYSRIKKSVAKSKSSNKDLLFAIRLLETTGAGIDFTNTTKNDFIFKIGKEFKSMKDRNEGIIGITKEDIEETRYWEEARVTIDIETENVSFEVFMNYDEDEEEAKEVLEDFKNENKKIGKINVDYYHLTFDECFKFEKTLEELKEKDTFCVYNNATKEYLFLIE